MRHDPEVKTRIKDSHDARLRRKRIRNYTTGKIAEWIASLWLRSRGYSILAMRAKTAAGEIDIIARKRDFLVFVEVKRRLTFDAAEAAITHRQRQRIRKAASVWITNRPHLQGLNMRFDVVFLVPHNWPRHIHNAL